MLSAGKNVSFILILFILSSCEIADTDREPTENDQHLVERTLGFGTKLNRLKRQIGGKGTEGKGKGFGKGKGKLNGKGIVYAY